MDPSHDNTIIKRCTKCGQDKPLDQGFWYIRQKTGKFDSPCKACQQDKSRKYARNHADERELYRRQDKAKDPTKYKIAIRKWRNANLVHVREYERLYRLEHLVERRSALAQYKKDNPSRFHTYYHRRKSKSQNVPSDYTELQWHTALDYFNHCCAICGKSPDFWTLIAQDHWLPVHLGGGTTALNIVPLCHARKGVPHGKSCCNNSKWKSEPCEWLYRTFKRSQADAILARIKAYFEWLQTKSS